MNRFTLKMLLVFGILSTVAYGQGSGSTAPPAKTTPGVSSDPNFKVTRTVSGSISNVNPDARQLAVKDANGKVYTLKVGEETKYQAGARNLAFQDLHDGQKIKVTYRAADSTALEIQLAQVRPLKR